MNTSQAWHTLSTKQVFDRLSTTAAGLTAEEAGRRLEAHGRNELPSINRVFWWTILLGQIKNILIIILLVATVISAFLGHTVEAIAITVIVVFAVMLGFIQEYRAEHAIEALRRMAAPSALVLRAGIETQISAPELVSGDLILLRLGDRVPADTRVIDAVNLQLDESSLTGESVPVEKQAAVLTDNRLTLAERNNMAYSGTVVTHGRGLAVVVATGMATEFGKITGMLREVKVGKTPLQQNLDQIGKVLAIVALIVVGLIVMFGLLRGIPLVEMFLFGVALAVAVVPEALPAVVTISLAIGVQRMIKRHVLIRHLPTVETLGSTSVICSDKTGTLTKNEMTARRLFVDNKIIEITGTGYEPTGIFEHNGARLESSYTLTELLRGAALASDARLIQVEGRWIINGDPTEGALIVAAAKIGLDKQELENTYPRVNEIPFSSENKRMTTLHTHRQGTVAYSKGAPEIIVSSCTRLLSEQGERVLDNQATLTIRETAKTMATDALRVLAVAYKPTTHTADAEREMVFLGLIGLIDPARPQAKTAIKTCEQAHIRAIMITGDHPATAGAIARELGLLKAGRVVTGRDLDDIPEREFKQLVRDIDVYARVSPEHKLRVVTAWQHQGHVVAMTGDGVNDAPALKKADVGVAMGITGTDVSKEAADIMLTDDNFASIVGAVEEGRVIFDNIKKYLMYLLSSNIGEIGLMAAATLTGLPLPLTAVQLLYVNLATDGLPALALAVDPPAVDLMRRAARDPRSGIFTRPVVILMVIGGIWSTVINLALFIWALHSGRELEHAMTMTFMSLVLIQFFKAYNFRSDRNSIFNLPFANKWLNLAILWELMLLGLIIYLPVLQSAFRTYSLTVKDWTIICALALTVLPVLEATKWMVRRGWF
jgi:Ca2+-transporting ATPase